MAHEAFAAKLTAYRRCVQGWVLLGYSFTVVLLLGLLALPGGLLRAMVAVGVAGIIFQAAATGRVLCMDAAALAVGEI